MVFADVSGFTRLSERLARRGKEGAEQLVDVINACFSALLAEAYGRGGSLLKFGGDAMLLLFYDQEGDQEHAARACCAAAAMRRTLREVGRIRAGDSNVVLRMSVGVHSGPYQMFVVGGSHREMLIGGPAASTVVALEGAASSGQILLSPETARWLPRSCVGQEVGPGLLLTRSPSACDWAPPTALPTPSEEAIARFLPTAIRAHLESGSAVPEHRTATVAFLQFEEFDRLLVKEGAETAARRLDQLLRLVQEAADRYDVCFLDSDVASDGGKIRLSAGAPRLVGDDEERMLLALRHIVEAGPPLPVKVGVNRGPVFTGPVGPDYRRWYAVMGDTVNLAARLVGKAPAGRIYATRDVLRGDEDDASSRPCSCRSPSRASRGRCRPGTSVRQYAGPRSVAIRLELPLVGRARELRAATRQRSPARSVVGFADRVGRRDGQRQVAPARGGRQPRHGNGLAARCVRGVHARHAVLGMAGPAPPAARGGRGDAGRGGARPSSEPRSSCTDPSLMPWMSLIAIVLDVELAPSRRGRAAVLRRPRREAARGRAPAAPARAGRPDDRRGRAGASDGRRLGRSCSRRWPASSSRPRGSSWSARRDEPGGLVLGRSACSDRARAAVARGHARACTVDRGGDPGAAPRGRARRRASGGSPQFLLDLLAAAAAGDRDELPESVGAATMARIDALDPRRRGDRSPGRRARPLVPARAS